MFYILELKSYFGVFGQRVGIFFVIMSHLEKDRFPDAASDKFTVIL